MNGYLYVTNSYVVIKINEVTGQFEKISLFSRFKNDKYRVYA